MIMRTRLRLSALLVWSACACFAQEAKGPEFEVASVRQAGKDAGPASTTGGPGSEDPERITYSNVTLKNVLFQAYGVNAERIAGPGWLDSERYHITAKLPRGATQEQFRMMLRNLLADRFKLTLHHDPKELAVLVLTALPGGLKIKEADPAQPRRAAAVITENGQTRITATRGSMVGLSQLLERQLGRPVLEQTGLTGFFSYTLEFAAENPAPDAPSGGRDIYTALQAMGLKLVARKEKFDFLVIDGAVKVPTEN